MKIRLYGALFLGLLAIFISTYSSNIISSTAVKKEIKAKAVTVQNIQETRLRIISVKTTLKRGETGSITILGEPNTTYTIETTYTKAGRTIAVRQWRTTDQNGNATFSWIVDPQTEVGTNKASIYGGGDKIDTSHTVIP